MPDRDLAHSICPIGNQEDTVGSPIEPSAHQVCPIGRQGGIVGSPIGNLLYW
jgi:hypothetical protein